MENILNEREVIRFLLDKGGRCTNFELVTNFRGVLNDPLYQGAARIKFKDIINTVAIVGEFQNTKFIELKKEFYLNHHHDSNQTELEPSSPSSDSSSSYNSPLTQSFQPYWRYRLSSSKQTLPSPPCLDFDLNSPRSRIHSGEPAAGRCQRSETMDGRRFSTNSMDGTRMTSHRSANDLQRSEGGVFPRRFSQSRSEAGDVFCAYPLSPGEAPRSDDAFQANRNPDSIWRGESFGPRSSETSLSRNMESLHGIHPSASNRNSGSIRRGESFNPRSSETSLSRNMESLHGIHPVNNRSVSYSTPPSYQESQGPSSYETDFSDSDNLRNVARALFKDPSSRISPRRPNDFQEKVPLPPTRTPNRDDSGPRRTPGSSGVPSWNPTVPKIMTPSNQSPKRSGPRHSISSSSESKDDSRNPPSSLIAPNHSKHSTSNDDHGHSNSNDIAARDPKHSISSNCDPKKSQGGPRDVTNFQRRNSNQELTPPNLDGSKNRYRSEGSLVSLRSEEDSSGFVSGSNSGSCTPESSGSRDVLPPPLPERKRTVEPAKFDDKVTKEKHKEEEEWTVSSAGKVRDRVQHFDDMEKKRNVKRSHSPRTPDKENRTSLHPKGLAVTEDDVSISVIDSKLRKEWFVKAAQCDYHALIGLLKKEAKLAALKDIAMTALHWAAKQGDANVIKLIAGTYKVNPNIRSGYTPVHLATLHKHDMIVHLLVHTYGADPTIRDYSGKKADQYPDHYLRVVAGRKSTEKKPTVKIIEPPLEKEVSNSFMRIGSLNLRKSRKSAVFASVRGRNWGSNNELRRGYRASMRKKLHKSLQFQPSLEKKREITHKNDSDSDTAFGFASKKHNS